MIDVSSGYLDIPAVETAGFKMIDVVRAKILSEKGVLKFPKRRAEVYLKVDLIKAI